MKRRTFTDPLDLDNVVTTKMVQMGNQYVIGARSADPVPAPHPCLLFPVNKKRNGRKPLVFVDTTRHSLPTVILFRQQQWTCRECGKPVYEVLPWRARRTGMTERMAEWVFRQAILRSFAQVAEECGLSAPTVATTFTMRAIPEVRKIRLATPRVLGLDEKHLFGGFRAVMGNVEQKTIFWMLKARNEAHLRPFFKKMKDRDHVEVVTIDMYRPYVKILHEFFPGAKLVVDKFHILRYATQAIDRARAAMRKTGQPRGERIRLLHHRYTLLKRRENWNHKDWGRYRDWQVRYPELCEVFELKEAVHDIFEHSLTRREAEQRYIEWRTNLPAKYRPVFKPFTRAMTNWGVYIFNYFDARYTNAYIERLNGMIDDANRVGRGYRFATLFFKMMLRHGTVKTPADKLVRDKGALDAATQDFEGHGATIDDMFAEYLDDDVFMHGVPLATLGSLLDDPDWA